MTFLLGLVKPFALKILIGIAVAGLVIAVYMRGRSSGRAEAVIEGLERKLENVERRHEVEREVDRLSGDAVADRLRERWSRD